VWHEYDKSRVKEVEMDHLSACGVWRIDRMKNVIVGELCGVKVNRLEGRRKVT